MILPSSEIQILYLQKDTFKLFSGVSGLVGVFWFAVVFGGGGFLVGFFCLFCWFGLLFGFFWGLGFFAFVVVLESFFKPTTTKKTPPFHA